MRAGTSLTGLGRYNENVVIHAFRRLGASSQRDVAASTGLSVQTVSAIVRGLQGRGLLAEVGTRVSGRGRPRTILDIVASARIAVGVHVDPSLITVVALDLGGEVTASASSTDVDADDPRSAMMKIAAMVRRLIRDGSVDERQLVGACLALPGPVDPATGAPDSAVWLPGWAKVPLGGKKFLKSVCDSTPADIAEVIVADNGSTDGSISFIKENFPSVRTILFDRNYGFTGGYNKAIESLSNEYVVLLNSDVETPNGWLEPLVEQMDQHPDVGACMPKIVAHADKGSFEYAGAAGGFLDRYGYPFCRGRILGRLEQDNGQYDTPMPIFWASGACLMVRTHLYKQLGGLDSDFFAHMEEIDFCWRLQHEGYRVMAYPQSKVFHVGGGTLPNNNPRKMYLNFRNSLLMLTKNLPSSSFAYTLFVRMVLDGAAGIAFLLQGKWGFFTAVLKAHRDFYRMLPKFLAKRKMVGHYKPAGFYRRSIVLSYFIKGKKTFDLIDLWKLSK